MKTETLEATVAKATADMSAAETLIAALAAQTSPVFGAGFVVATSPGVAPKIDLDTAFLSFRVAPPTKPGLGALNPVTGQPYGTGAWAVDVGHLYVIVQDITGAFIWARAELSTVW